MSEGMVKERAMPRLGKVEWDAYLASGEMVGYGFATRRRADNFLKRAIARRRRASGSTEASATN